MAGGVVTGAAVRNDPPVVDDWGLVVRPLLAGLPIIIIDPATFGTAVVTSVPIAVVSTTLLAANASRKAATFYNDSVNRFLYLKWGTPASTTSFTVRIGPGGYYELPQAIYNGIITGIWNAAGAGACRITELTPP